MQKKKGISLIVLVITIIVMIILAGAVIISLNNSGIISNASKATKDTNIAQMNTMLASDAYLSLYTSGNLKTYTDEQLYSYYNTYLTDRNYTVPAGYELKINAAKAGVIAETIDGTQMKGTGTEEDPYQVDCIEHLLIIASATNGSNTDSYTGQYFKLMRDLDFNDGVSYANALDKTTYGDYNQDGVTDTIKGEITTSSGWVPIGKNATINSSTYAFTGGNIFAGNFDGNSKEIRNLYINKTHTEMAPAGYALFGAVKGNISNLTVTGNVTVLRNASYGIAVAGIVAQSEKTVQNCVNRVNVNFTDNVSGSVAVGGVCGLIEGSGSLLQDCKNYGDINANKSSGGVAGVAVQSIVNRCENYGKILVPYGAGVVSSPYYAYIYNSFNGGEVSTSNTSHAGGIAASASGSSSIINCYNIGKVRGTSYAGGIIGYNYTGNASYNIVNNCYNIGEALAGINGYTATVTNSYYLASKSIAGGYGNSDGTEIITYSALLTSLNNNISGITSSVELSSWKMGSNGYPVFSWQE